MPVALRHRLLGLHASLSFERFVLLYRKYSPNQPRVPAGIPEGGQFAPGGGGDEGSSETDRPLRIAVNAPRRPRGAGAGRWPDATPGQQARLAASEAEANAAVAHVQQVEGAWRPQPGLYENIEGEILNNQSITRQAEARLVQFRAADALPGPFAAGSIPAPQGGRRLSAEEQREIDRIGRTFGCHSCGSLEPGTRSRSYIGDHQWPRALHGSGEQRVYPQCVWCSRSQGGRVMNSLRNR